MAKISGLHIPAELKNLAINGGMDFFQRFEGGTISISTSTTNQTCADMFSAASAGSTTKSLSVTRNTSVPTQAQSGFQSTYSMQVVNNTVVSSPAASDVIIAYDYRMEGLDYAKIHAKQATFGFWFNTTVAGTYSFALRNGSFNRSYVTTFSAVTGWQFITITVQMDTSGTWAFDNSIGLSVNIGNVCGSTATTSTLNAWQAGSFSCANTATNWAATSGATLQLTQFSIVEGPLGFSSTGFARNGRSIQQELALCQRYYEKTYDIGTAVGTATSTGMIGVMAGPYSGNSQPGVTWVYKVTKRAAPSSITPYSTVNANTPNVVSYSSTTAAAPTTDVSAALIAGGLNGALLHCGSAVANQQVGFHGTAEAGL